MSIKVLIIFILLATCNNAFAKKVCLTGSTVKVLPRYGEAFINGIKMGLEKNKHLPIELGVYFFDPSPIGSLKITKKMLRDGCDFIIGFDTSNDIIPIKTILEQYKIPLLSLYSIITPDITSAFIRSMQPSTDQVTLAITNYFTKKRKIKKAIIMTSVDKAKMRQFRKSYSKLFKKRGIEVVHSSIVERNLNISDLFIKLKSFPEPDVFVLLARSSLSAKIVNYVNKTIAHKKYNPLYIGTLSWGSSKLPAFYDRLNSKNIEAYFVRQNSYLDRDIKFSALISSYKNKFGKDPMVISALAYDAIKIALKVLNKDKSTPYPFFNFEYQGPTGVEVQRDGTFLHHKTFIMKVTKNGYKLAK